jgi:hypothetical protein
MSVSFERPSCNLDNNIKNDNSMRRYNGNLQRFTYTLIFTANIRLFNINLAKILTAKRHVPSRLPYSTVSPCTAEKKGTKLTDQTTMKTLIDARCVNCSTQMGLFINYAAA